MTDSSLLALFADNVAIPDQGVVAQAALRLPVQGCDEVGLTVTIQIDDQYVVHDGYGIGVAQRDGERPSSPFLMFPGPPHPL